MKNLFFTTFLIIGIISHSSGQQLSGTAKKSNSVNIEAAKKPVYVVDGLLQNTKTDFSIVSLNPETIAEVIILKGNNAVNIFGPEANGGAVIITTISGKTTLANKALENKIALFDNVSKLSNLAYKPKTDKVDDTPMSSKDLSLVFRSFNRPLATNDVLYILDGNRIEKKEMDALDAKNILAMQILKNKTAIELYGPLASNGVVLITTKPKPILKATEKPVDKY